MVNWINRFCNQTDVNQLHMLLLCYVFQFCYLPHWEYRSQCHNYFHSYKYLQFQVSVTNVLVVATDIVRKYGHQIKSLRLVSHNAGSKVQAKKVSHAKEGEMYDKMVYHVWKTVHNVYMRQIFCCLPKMGLTIKVTVPE